MIEPIETQSRETSPISLFIDRGALAAGFSEITMTAPAFLQNSQWRSV
jgi:hypothetical protein